MTLFEVEVKTVSSVFYLVEADSADAAGKLWSNGVEQSEFIDSEDVIRVNRYDDRFEDDDDYDDSEEEDEDEE